MIYETEKYKIMQAEALDAESILHMIQIFCDAVWIPAEDISFPVLVALGRFHLTKMSEWHIIHLTRQLEGECTSPDPAKFNT